MDPAFLDQPLHLRAGLLGQERGQEVIEAHAVVLGLDDQLAPRRSVVDHGVRPPARAARRPPSGPVRLPSTTSMMIASGTISSDTNCEVESAPTIPRGSPR